MTAKEALELSNMNRKQINVPYLNKDISEICLLTKKILEACLLGKTIISHNGMISETSINHFTIQGYIVTKYFSWTNICWACS